MICSERGKPGVGRPERKDEQEDESTTEHTAYAISYSRKGKHVNTEDPSTTNNALSFAFKL
jgi:hypothetical protein